MTVYLNIWLMSNTRKKLDTISDMYECLCNIVKWHFQSTLLKTVGTCGITIFLSLLQISRKNYNTNLQKMNFKDT